VVVSPYRAEHAALTPVGFAGARGAVDRDAQSCERWDERTSVPVTVSCVVTTVPGNDER